MVCTLHRICKTIGEDMSPSVWTRTGIDVAAWLNSPAQEIQQPLQMMPWAAHDRSEAVSLLSYPPQTYSR